MTDRPIPAALRPLFGDPSDAMELAKKIIGGKLKVNHDILLYIGSVKDNPKWARIASIYALGFIGKDEFAPQLRAILSDPGEDTEVRGHAAEALGNIRDR